MDLKRYIGLLFGVYCISLGYGQTFNREKLDKYFDSLHAHQQFMGTVALRKGDSLIYQRSIGYADLKGKQPTDSATRYRIGSVSKTFTAVLVLKAVEQGKLSLEQSIEKWFPQIENAESITIEDLLRHSSGIHNFTEHPMYKSWRTLPRSRDEMLNLIIAGGLDFEPGSKKAYSNSNYLLLSYLLEDIYAQSYSRLLATFITRPLGLQGTYLGADIDRDKKEAYSYAYVNAWNKEAHTHSSIALGAGALVSTPADLTRFAHALFKGELLDSTRMEQMKTLKDGFGLGLFSFPFYDYSALGHTGGIDGFRSVLGYFEAQDISYALCSNGTRSDPNQVSIAVLSAVFNKPYALPEFTSLKVDTNRLEQYTGLYNSAEIPIEIRVFRKGDQLFAQGTAQASFPLEAQSESEFQFYAGGIQMKFNRMNQTMILTQAGRSFAFTLKEKYPK